MNITYCDVCGEECPKKEELWQIKIAPQGIFEEAKLHLHEVCEKCAKKIAKEIKDE